MKTQKNLSLDVRVVERLREVDNQSALVQQLLIEYFDMDDVEE